MNPSHAALCVLLTLGSTCAQERNADELRARLPETKALAVRRGELILSVPGKTYRVVDVTPHGNPVLRLGSRRVGIDSGLLLQEKARALYSLDGLVKVAAEAELALDAFTLEDWPLVGPLLHSERRVVMPEGVLDRRAVEVAPTPSIERALSTTRAALASNDSLGDLAKQSILNCLKVLEDPALETDTLPADLVRRLIREGWLRQLLGEPAAALEAAVRARATPTLREAWSGPGLRIERYEDLHGSTLTVVETPYRTAFMRPAPQPAYHPNPPAVDLAVWLKHGTDPFTATEADVQGASLSQNNVNLARWTRDRGLRSVEATWRKVFTIPADEGASLVPGFLPPHIPVASPTGTFFALHTRHGSVLPQPGDAEAFLKQAAQALPDAAHLDLIGEYLFAYVNDSPDPRLPSLVGSSALHGEIHQTVEETLANDAGGICRGDCDDLAEIYYELARRQGRLAHIVSLPGHAALLWADREEDGVWRTSLLQTGPPLSFTGETLPEALEASYGAFGMIDVFDADQVGIAVRFAGENIRSNWVLGWRIFRDADYAETMIDIQRDWHDHTYLRGIDKIRRLLDAGDEDPANYRELAGLYRATGQWKLASGNLAIAAEKGGDPTKTLAIDRLNFLFLAKEPEAAVALARELIDEDLPALAPKLGPSFYGVAMRLAEVLAISGKRTDLAAEVCEEFLIGTLSQLTVRVAVQIEEGLIDAADFREDPQLGEVRRLLRGWFLTSMTVLDGASPSEVASSRALQGLVSSAEIWIQSLAFHDWDLPADLSMRYAQAAEYITPFLGQAVADAAIRAAPYPEGPKEDHAKRAGSLVQFRRDLPWIKASIPHFSGEIYSLFAFDEEELDRKRLDALYQGLLGAERESKRLGWAHPDVEARMLTGHLLHALVHEDAERVRKIFMQVFKADDKILRDHAVQLLGLCARHLDMDWYGKVLNLFAILIDHEPSWFQIAWTAYLNKAPQHALSAAERAVAAHPERKAFANERNFLRALVPSSPR